MFNKSDDIAKTGKLIVTVAAVAVDPTGLAAAGVGLDAYLHLHESLTKQNPELGNLSKELEKDLNKALKDPNFHLPKDADIHLPQMIEASLPPADDFAKANLAPDKVLQMMVARFREPRHRDADMKAAFEKLLLPLLTKAANDTRLVAALQPALVRKQLEQGDAQSAKLDEVLRRLGGFDAALANPDAVSVEDLQTIAIQFGEGKLTERAALLEYLTQKAEEYRRYRDQIARLDDRVAAIANLKGAAQDAADRLDFDEVEELLARVDEVETGIAAETKEARAANALLRGRVEQAFDILSAAAEGFRGIDRLEPARRRLGYEDLLYQHGLRYGGVGLAKAAEMCRAALADLSAAETPELWAVTQNDLGNALRDQGNCIRGAEGETLLGEAVTAYRAALRVWTEGDHPVHWAMTQNNLGAALRNQGSRIAGAEGATLLGDAVTAFRAALRVRTIETHRVQWAETQENMAIAELELADHDATTEAEPHPEAALSHVAAALLVYDPEHMAYNHGTATRLREDILGQLGRG